MSLEVAGRGRREAWVVEDEGTCDLDPECSWCPVAEDQAVAGGALALRVHSVGNEGQLDHCFLSDACFVSSLSNRPLASPTARSAFRPCQHTGHHPAKHPRSRHRPARSPAGPTPRIANKGPRFWKVAIGCTVSRFRVSNFSAGNFSTMPCLPASR
jgi:hypothetical protein